MNIALIGYGDIGSKVYNNIIKNPNINIKYVGVKNNKNNLIIPFTTDIFSIINDDSIQLIIECINDNLVAKKIINDSIMRGIHVITCNKPAMWNFGRELSRLATKNNVTIYLNSIIASDKNNYIEEDVFLTNRNFHNYSDDELYAFSNLGVEETSNAIIKDLYYHINKYGQK
jgi:predicted dinucleotide-utilizing enzyme